MLQGLPRALTQVKICKWNKENHIVFVSSKKYITI